MSQIIPKSNNDAKFDWRIIADHVETIMSEMSVMVTVQDTRGRLLYANPSAAKMLDQDARFDALSNRAAKLMQKYLVFNQSDKEVKINELPSRRVARGEPWAESVQHYVAKDGSKEFWLIIKAVPVLDKNGKTRFVITIANDVTALKQTEISLRGNNDRLMHALEGVMESETFDASPRRRG